MYSVSVWDARRLQIMFAFRMHLLHQPHSRRFAIFRQPEEYLLYAQSSGTRTNLFVDLEEFCYTSIDANTFPLVQVRFCVSCADTFIMTRPGRKEKAPRIETTSWRRTGCYERYQSVEDIRYHVKPTRRRSEWDPNDAGKGYQLTLWRPFPHDQSSWLHLTLNHHLGMTLRTDSLEGRWLEFNEWPC